ncbi:HPP family protein [Sphingopyxis bauzanensis]|uniref:HPP family protein n=2 Tax=Sphingopyxis bauzanensis TaxID=651663 RepID=A0A246JW66_9SPHN|nr:HPP family protein [Sphingopyxis bauzanensis]
MRISLVRRTVLRFRPLLAGARPGDRVIACLGAFAAIAGVAGASAVLLASMSSIWLVAPIGASAVLVFAVPASPLAQPWPVIGGNMLSALVGVAVAQVVSSPEVAAALAVALAIALMSLTRSLHPPGGAAALTAVIGESAIHALGWGFPFLIVGLNSLLLVIAAMAFHRLSGHSYPHRIRPSLMDTSTEDRSPLDAEDIEAVLSDIGESFDIAPDDLVAIVRAVERRAANRQLPTAVTRVCNSASRHGRDLTCS